jgi:hypothetical protein
MFLGHVSPILDDANDFSGHRDILAGYIFFCELLVAHVVIHSSSCSFLLSPGPNSGFFYPSKIF